MSEYRDHPLLEGFRDKPDSELLEVSITQIDMAEWIKDGAKFGKEGIPEEVKQAIRDGFKDVPRAGLEKLLYHAIVAALEANQKAHNRGKDPTIPSTTG